MAKTIIADRKAILCGFNNERSGKMCCPLQIPSSNDSLPAVITCILIVIMFQLRYNYRKDHEMEIFFIDQYIINASLCYHQSTESTKNRFKKFHCDSSFMCVGYIDKKIWIRTSTRKITNNNSNNLLAYNLDCEKYSTNDKPKCINDEVPVGERKRAVLREHPHLVSFEFSYI